MYDVWKEAAAFSERSKKTNIFGDIGKEKYGKVINLCMYQTSLELHSKRANFVAKMWWNAANPILELDDPCNHGWLPDMTIN